MRTAKMLRAVTLFYVECKASGIVFRSRRDVFKIFCAAAHTSVTDKTQIKTVLMSPRGADSGSVPGSSVAPPAHNMAPPQSGRLPPPPPPPPRPSRFASAWTAATAFAITASLGGVYFYKKMDQPKEENTIDPSPPDRLLTKQTATPISSLPSHVEFLLVGAGTASFAALRALRAARPEASILLAGDENAPPYMRPPLSKEVWREASLGKSDASSLSFKQWSGRRRWLVYEPLPFYQPPTAAPALGWTVESLDPASRSATLRAGEQTHKVTYDQCLLAPGATPRRVAGLAGAGGRALVLRGAGDAARLAAELDARTDPTLLVVGGGLLGSEISAAISISGRAHVVLAVRGASVLQSRLPGYLAADAAATLADHRVQILTHAEVVDSSVGSDGRVRVKFGDGREVTADLVLQCAGADPRTDLAARAGLELDPHNGGIVVDAELRARSGVWAAGDAASFYDAGGGRRRRAAHHDHAVRSGRRAAENMAAAAAAADHADHADHAAPPPAVYDYRPMFWSDLGPDLGYEAVGVIDSRLPTVGIFSEEFVHEAKPRALTAGVNAADTPEDRSVNAADTLDDRGGDATHTRKYERGVVFYMEGKRVVGVLLWNLFNRVTLASQVLAQGEFDDLMEVAKLFTPHEEQ